MRKKFIEDIRGIILEDSSSIIVGICDHINIRDEFLVVCLDLLLRFSTKMLMVVEIMVLLLAAVRVMGVVVLACRIMVLMMVLRELPLFRAMLIAIITIIMVVVVVAVRM